MPGRQSHGRSLLAAPKTKNINRSKARSQKSVLNALNTAAEQYPTRIKKTPRVRELDAEVERKHGREEGEDDEDEDEDDEPSRKKAKRPAARGQNADAEYGSDSDGNEWQLGGMGKDDEDSEIESDDAFGDSDNEKFEEYQFRGSKSKRKPADDDSDDDSNDDEGQTLGAEAIDLATALDQFEEDSDEEDGSQEDSDDEGDEDGSDEDDEDDESVEDADPEKLDALQGLISGFGGEEDGAKDKPSSKQKISFGDLGLSELNDPLMRKSVKLMNKEEKEKRPGAAKKLDVPLSRREQGRLDRSAAYETTNKTLERWTETVKHNRRAGHLVFPLPENAPGAGVDRTWLQPLSTAKPANELESAIMSIMTESGLSLEPPPKPKTVEYDDEGNELSRRAAINRRRLERELASRETKRAARIKKIKSKAYHRVHRRERERGELAAREAMDEAGELDSEAEREAQDRRRALERVGQRHKDSKWAKLGNRTKRAVWDDEFRTGLTEMARRDEELRRRKEGKRGGADEDDEDATSSESDDDDGDGKLRRQLAELAHDDDDEPQSKLMAMKFMQKAEAARKQENDQLIKEIQKGLNGEEQSDESDDEAADEVGRRSYGDASLKMRPVAIDLSKKKSNKSRAPAQDGDDDDDDVVITTTSNGAWSAPAADTSTATTGAWSRGESRRKASKSARAEDLDLSEHIAVAGAPRSTPKSQPAASSTDTTAKRASTTANNNDSDSDSDADQHLPMAVRDQALVARAFAGEDVVGEFAREKAAVAAADDDHVVDTTLPGWGAWVGAGVSQRELKRNAGRFLKTVTGVVKAKDRKDAKLSKVMINEKRVKKNNLYRATQLPHPFESKEQYERSLRLPIGPEWVTKVSFQDNTKPRVLVKQGIITPMSKPTR
ncbi:small nucleolar ribonucleoprotein complex subunit Utp14 [Cordyceps militaris CM01]|uniref:Small nucleolar ribonucleoprotein complex subunit Utp14 n=1 Tax=Cordyceps militaris (strain CM01) TaxID=983644 RepID=G3JHJ2_CORMM|nr:small nucleolar ribonucleoprotein complex subunit Utp14 [Cordyceps militaris CM01]EGX90900.1 small nucleolar ribonucleoprotein complex subunit Utp14 [Cordyceps militaris CM01]